MSELLPFKAGDAYLETCQDFEGDGMTPAPITSDMTIASSIMDASGVLFPLTVTINPDQVANPGIYTLTSSATASMAHGWASRDIVYIVAGLATHTNTDRFLIEGVITPWPQQ